MTKAIFSDRRGNCVRFSYERLVFHHPEVMDYKLYHAQSLYKATQYDEAFKVSNTIDDAAYTQVRARARVCVCEVCV